MIDFKALEKKWQTNWEKNKTFEATPQPGKKKFMLTFPYPYMNGYLHIGHFYTLMRTEVLARFKRLTGHNVLFPQGWHCTGSPINAAADRIKEKEPKQWESMRKMGFKDKEIEKFSEPEYWTTFFPKEALKDYQRMGMSVDFRRQFITTALNPCYNKFIEWQFRKLKEKGFVSKGKHPVVWDPVSNMPVGDHDRSEGEGETPQEFLLVKHKLEDGRFIISATLRPDTILGITNLYLNPEAEYQIIEIEASNGKETWILGESGVKRLQEQDWKLTVTGTVSGQEFMGKMTEEFGGRKIPVLPATFLDSSFGTGLVHSVPADSADDLIALYDLQKDEETCKKYSIDREIVKKVVPIENLDTKGIGGNPADHFLKKYGVKHQNDRKKLDEIKKELYKLSFYAAKFGKIYKGVFERDIVGKSVQDEKAYVQQELIKQGWAETYYQLTGKVVSRNLNNCIVKVVSDQWFISYGDSTWKDTARKALANMRIYPEKARSQFEHVISWLNHWACTREVGLGTKLPWDKKWVIESLSDSTIYNAYYTFAHLIIQLPIDAVTDELFDYILLGKGKAPIKEAKAMKAEFDYWYPVDFRNSGKDLIQNHLTFYIFNHVALFPEKHWPKGIGVNGWVTVDGQKMSKSLGNMILLRDMADKFGVDASRLTIMSGGESLDDPNWDSEFARSVRTKLDQWYAFCTENYQKDSHSTDMSRADLWMKSKLHETIQEAAKLMDDTLFRSASQKIFFDLNNAIKWYMKRSAGKPNTHLLSQAIEAQIVMMSSFTPFICEEIWETIGKDGLVSEASWPEVDESAINPQLDHEETLIESLIDDIGAVLKLAKLEKPASITLFLASSYKYDLFSFLAKKMKNTRNPKEIFPKVMVHNSFKKYGQDISKLLPKLFKSGKIPVLGLSHDQEKETLTHAHEFLSDLFNAKIVIEEGETSEDQKAKQALPGKPAILAK